VTGQGQGSREALDWWVGDPLRVEALEAIARGAAHVRGPRKETLARTATARAALQEQLAADGVVYGVNTGFGDSCEVSVRGTLIEELPTNLFRFHGCGVGADFSVTETRAILLARLASLATGYSAVRGSLLEALVALVERGVTPRVPSIGSVGASGDLTPLSYVAAVLAGERDADLGGRRLPAAEALALVGLAPLHLEPKESLALMNGTSAMTGVAALCLPRSLRLARWAAALTAGTSEAVRGQARHFDARIFAAKPHPGQALVARWIREDLESDLSGSEEPARVQDRYSLRCAPHVLGVLVDLLPTFVRLLETELNGASDNPLVDPESGDVLHGGNFYGGHVCAVMDTLKTQVANVADLLDRQLALLCNPVTSHGLPANLVGAPAAERAAHHGFKAMQITASALAAEVAKLCLPASVLSRSTENHNQDKVSMGTLAARDCARALELTETLAAISTLAVAQAAELRGFAGCRARTRTLHAAVREASAFVSRDRALDGDIDAVLLLAEEQLLPIGPVSLDELRAFAP
jgi:histidine ammonia-lyase